MANEVGLTKQDLRRHVLREVGAHFFERPFDLAGECEGVEPRGLVDAENDAHFSIHAGISAHRLDCILDFGDIADEHGSVIHNLDDGVSDVFKAGRHAKIPHHDFTWTGLEIAAGGVSGCAACGGVEFVKGHAERCEPPWVGLNLHLLDSASNGQYLSHAPDALKLASDRPIGQRAQVHGSDLVVLAAEADEEDLAHQ